jgi:integrase
MRLTEAAVKALAGPAGARTAKGKVKKDVVVFAVEPRGLAVRVAASAVADSLAGKTYLVRYMHAGRKRTLKIGPCASVKLAVAVKEATAILGEVARNRDPFSERQEAKRKAEEETYTLDKLVGEWMVLGLRSNKPSYRREAPHVIRVVFKALLNRPAAAIDRKAVVVALNVVKRRGAEQMAARAAGYANAAYGWGIKHDKVAINPFVKLPVAKTKKRDRALADAEIAALWRATETPVGLGVFNAIVRMLLLTGQRRGEISGMTWSELSADLAIWTLPKERAKNSVEHIVPLSRQAREIIEARPRSNMTQLVFPGERGDNVYNGWSIAKVALDRASGVVGWTLHDLRRTVATNLQKLGVRLEVTEAVLNHVSGSRAGVVGVYQRHDWAAEKRAALQAWADRFDAIVEGRSEESNVVELGVRRWES